MRIIINNDIGIKIFYEFLFNARDASLVLFVKYNFNIFFKELDLSTLII